MVIYFRINEHVYQLRHQLDDEIGIQKRIAQAILSYESLNIWWYGRKFQS